MIGINKDDVQVRLLLDRYLSEAKLYFGIKPENFKATKAKDKSKLQKIAKPSNGVLYAEMFQYFHNHFEMVIVAEPEGLKKMQQSMLKKVKYKAENPNHQTELEHFKNTMIHYYEGLMKQKIKIARENISLGRWLTRSLGQSVCPFCNHNYTLTVNDKKNKIIVRPDFDHFYAKSKNPLLAVSFFNLVPICGTCNKLKGEQEVFQSPYDASYERPKFKLYGKDESGNRVLFGLGDSYDQVELVPEADYSKDNPRTCNIKKLGIKQIYDQQIDHVNTLIDMAQQYHAGSYTALVDSFQGLGKTEAEIDRIIWGVYKDELHRRPLSKLTSDVLEQIGLKNSKS